MSAQPNRKQQRLARELARLNGVSYQAALAQVRTASRGPNKDVIADPHRGMLEALYDAFAPTTSSSPADALQAVPTPAAAELIDEGSSNRRQPRAFISYSRQDEAFVLALVQQLKEHGIGVWIDCVDLVIGDSLIRRIGDAIYDEDFVIAVISEHSVKSSWCEKELSLAVAHGIQSKQVKVLPVRLDEVTLPSFLVDTLWVETDRSDCTGVASQLATAVERHLERRGFGVGTAKPHRSTARAVEQQAVAPGWRLSGRPRSRTDAPMVDQPKNQAEWQPDIDRSVAEYDEWYLAESSGMLEDARGRAAREVEEAMLATDDFRMLDAKVLIARPATLFVARMCVSPPMTRDRFVGFSGANKRLVTAMERDGVIPAKTSRVGIQLQAMCDFLRPLLDRGLFCWLENDRAPTVEERDKALLLIGERLASAFYLPVLRNAQEVKQKELLRAYLEGEGFEESRESPFEMPPGTFGFGRNVRVEREDGYLQNLPVDCVVSPLDAQLPLACVELKMTGDFTNAIKRRKEESDKSDALKRAHGDNAVFVLQLFGYFGRSYLDFQTAAGINWAWDHRLGDFARNFGIGVGRNTLNPRVGDSSSTFERMSLNLENLDATTRGFMLQEFEMDETAGRLHPSSYFAAEGIAKFPALLREAIGGGDDESLAVALSSPGIFLSHYRRKTGMAKVPRTAPMTFAEGEFNRFYIRGLCLRVGDGGMVEVYRARTSSSARPESEALIGKSLSAVELLEDLRRHIGEPPTLLPYVNSGLSVRLLS